MKIANSETVDLTPENIILLQQLLSIAVEAQEDCPVFPFLTKINGRFAMT
jgi:hypothetical protein